MKQRNPPSIRYIALFTLPVALGSLFFFGSAAHAATSTVVVSSDVTSTRTWTTNNIYVIKGSPNVNAGVTLTIASGTIVEFSTSTDSFTISGTLNSQGVAGNPVTFTTASESTGTPAVGDWENIQTNAGSSSTFNYTNIRYGGKSVGAVLTDIYADGGTLTVTNSRIASSTDYGIQMPTGTVSIVSSTFSTNGVYGITSSGGSALTITTSTFLSNSTAAAFIDPGSAKLVFSSSGNNATGTGEHGFILNDTFGASQTWGKDIPYILQNVTVASGTTLTLNPGAVMKFSTSSSDLVVNANGTLNVQGTSTNPIYFTALTDSDSSVGGNTINIGSSTTPKPGDSGYIQVSAGASTTINSAVVRYGGSSNGNSFSDIYVTGGTINVSNSTIASSSHDGIRTYIAKPVMSITSSQFRNNGEYGIYETASSGTIALTSNAFANNSSSDVYFDVGAGITFTNSGNNDTSTATGTGYRGIVLGGTLAASSTWTGDALPYVIESSVAVASGTTLTINPSWVKFSQGADLEVANHGTLKVAFDGNIEHGFSTFTSLTDDSVGGDTNADGTSTVARPGDSGYIQLDSGSNSTITEANFFYSGITPAYSSIYQTGGNLTVSNASIVSSSNDGLRLTGGTSTITTSNFINDPYGVYMTAGSLNIGSSTFESTSSAYYGVFNGSNVTSTATATNNYWNSYSGPYNATSHPTGTVTEEVSDYVTYNPWINNTSTRNHYLNYRCEGISTSTITLCSSVASSSQIIYNASTTYLTAWNAAVNAWAALGAGTPGGITLTSTTLASSTNFLKVYDVDSSDIPFDGRYTPTSDGPTGTTPLTSSTIFFNRYYADSFSAAQLQHMAMHELGHGFGLDDESIPTNVEYFYNTPQDTLGDQDVSDYSYLW